jgi:hypothetical protein
MESPLEIEHFVKNQIPGAQTPVMSDEDQEEQRERAAATPKKAKMRQEPSESPLMMLGEAASILNPRKRKRKLSAIPPSPGELPPEMQPAEQHEEQPEVQPEQREDVQEEEQDNEFERHTKYLKRANIRIKSLEKQLDTMTRHRNLLREQVYKMFNKEIDLLQENAHLSHPDKHLESDYTMVELEQVDSFLL